MVLNSLRHSQWLRHALRALLLCFALSTLAHAGHEHAPDRDQQAYYQCEFCTGFGGLIDAPQPAVTVLHVARGEPEFAAPVAGAFVTPITGLPQARAPPEL